MRDAVTLTGSLILAGVVALVGGCRDGANAKAAQLHQVETAREQNLARRIGAVGAQSPNTPLALWVMPAELREISGLALNRAGELLAHDDEIGRIYAINPKSGIILRRFTLQGAPHGDFEGITVAGNDVYLLESNGRLLRFKEAGDGEQPAYTKFDTHLGHECEFEGVAFEADSSRLLLPCKKVAAKSLKEDLVIYRIPVPLTSSSPITMMRIPLANVVGANSWKGFAPSDITIDPANGNYVLIAAQEKALAVITPAGVVVKSESLPPGHPQAEGVAITPDNILIVSDEATRNPAHIALYRWQR
jgi:uncharacterized protein YjiK